MSKWPLTLSLDVAAVNDAIFRNVLDLHRLPSLSDVTFSWLKSERWTLSKFQFLHTAPLTSASSWPESNLLLKCSFREKCQWIKQSINKQNHNPWLLNTVLTFIVDIPDSFLSFVWLAEDTQTQNQRVESGEIGMICQCCWLFK